jgi:hypothetical protein
LASGAGLNRIGPLGGIPILSAYPTVAAVAAPFAGYGVNSGGPPYAGNDSGIQLVSAVGFSKYIFSIIGPNAATPGYTISVYGTIDPALLTYLETNHNAKNGMLDGDVSGIVPATSWFLLSGPADQTGTGAIANPMVTGGGSSTTTVVHEHNFPLVAIRAVVTATNAPTGNVTLLAMVTP